MKILIADDMELNRKLLKAVLEAENFEVLVANDGAEALGILKQTSVDAVISDILMPNLDGYRLCYEVRNDERLRSTPIVIYSASYTSPDDEKLALQFGADKYIKKSSSNEEILNAVREVISSARREPNAGKHSVAELETLKQYSQRLIEKLEERNVELETAQDMLTRFNDELRRRTMELQESEEKFRGILNRVQDVFFRADRKGNVQMVSPSIQRYGYEVDELIGSNIRDLCAVAADATRFSAQMVRNYSVNDFELTVRRKDGSTLIGSISARVLTDNNGAITGVDGFVRDITERKHSEEILRERSRLAALVAEIGVALISTRDLPEILGRCAQCLSRNLRAAMLARIWIFDSADGELKLHASAGIQDECDTPLLQTPIEGAGIRRIARSLSPYIVKDPGDDPNLFKTYSKLCVGMVSFAGYPLIIGDRLLGVLAICGRKQFSDLALEALASVANAIALGIDRKMDEAALRKAEEKYRSIFENSSEGIFQGLPSGEVLTANPAVARILGYASPEDMMANVGDVSQRYVRPEERDKLLAIFDKDGFSRGAEVELYTKDRRKIWAFIRGRAVKDTSGTVIYYEGSLEDVTNRKQLEEQLFQSQKMEAVGRLAGGIAHDFNNLLTAIIGYSTLAKSDLDSQSPIVKHIDEVEKAGRTAAALTAQLLLFSRKHVIQPTILDLNAVITAVEKMLRRMIGEDVILSTRLAPGVQSVKADPGQLEQIIMNLAVNARDAMPDGGSLVIETANVKLDESYCANHIGVALGPYVMMGVTDSGIGMDKEIQSRIFEPFFTTKEIGKGTGLGLSTVYGIVKQNGGIIEVESEIGVGTVFKIYLPRVGASTSAPVAVERLEVAGGSETILLVEDDDAVRQLTTLSLETSGYCVLSAASAEQAFALTANHIGKINLLVTDVIMPGSSGPKLADEMLSSGKVSKVLFISGYTDGSLFPLNLGSGKSFLQKPFTPSALASKVRKILDQQDG